ncbi:HAD family hydrolase [Cohnella herbarum]|uniref:HAD family hydrolase n=1 Tax=Cohnella herbarum TaxID=2728023 RepID=A0A7Z2VN54_9BACL|nr:HAD family hydrolase [Cohnella herbarum]QJD86381.1 HAD family hydrolase [Cohnella herbarum]
MAIRAVVFDFDGTLMDTESCAYDTICSIYAEHGQELPLETWAVCIGTVGGFDPYRDLEMKTGRTLDHEELRNRYKTRHIENVKSVTLRPGALDRLEEARRLGLKIGLASSSDRAWIEMHLERQGIRDYFEVIRSSDDVKRVKPDPELYRLAVEALGVRPEEAIAVEDSMNGLRAAKAAGLYGLVVPNPVTAQMDFSEADLLLGSLEGTTWEEIMRQAVR